MSSNTKIVVLRSKELIYALVLLIVVVLIIIVAVSLFVPNQNNNSNNTPPASTYEESTAENESTEQTAAPDFDNSETNETEGTTSLETASLYVPGVYASTLQLGNTNLELQITVDKDHINSISFTNIDESVSTMYPLMEPALNKLSTEILSNQSIDNISYTEENRYTSMLLMQAISETIKKAKLSENADSPDTSLYNKEMN